jgi:molecular chaperone DnaK
MTLGHFRLEGIPPAPRGMPQVDVTFDIDANGILNVAARDKATGKEQKVTITASTNLNKADIERMVSEAKKNEAADRRQRELVEARNNADSLAYTAEKALRDLGDRVPGNDRQNIEHKIQALREAMKGDDVNRIRQLSDEVQQASYALGQQAAAGRGPSPETGGTASGRAGDGQRRDEGDVVEGEFRET